MEEKNNQLEENYFSRNEKASVGEATASAKPFNRKFFDDLLFKYGSTQDLQSDQRLVKSKHESAISKGNVNDPLEPLLPSVKRNKDNKLDLFLEKDKLILEREKSTESTKRAFDKSFFDQ